MLPDTDATAIGDDAPIGSAADSTEAPPAPRARRSTGYPPVQGGAAMRRWSGIAPGGIASGVLTRSRRATSSPGTTVMREGMAVGTVFSTGIAAVTPSSGYTIRVAAPFAGSRPMERGVTKAKAAALASAGSST